MGFEFRHSIDISRPSADVFSFLADFENNPRWQDGMVHCRWTSEPPHQVGSTYVQEAKFMGRQIDTHFKVTELDPGRSISIESTQSTFPIQVTRSVEPLDADRTRVEVFVRGQPKGILKLFSPMVRRNITRDYQRLKVLLEA